MNPILRWTDERLEQTRIDAEKAMRSHGGVFTVYPESLLGLIEEVQEARARKGEAK